MRPIFHKLLLAYLDEFGDAKTRIAFPKKILDRCIFTYCLLCLLSAMLFWRIFIIAGLFFAVSTVVYAVLLIRFCRVLELSVLKISLFLVVLAFVFCALGVAARYGFLLLWDKLVWFWGRVLI